MPQLWATFKWNKTRETPLNYGTHRGKRERFSSDNLKVSLWSRSTVCAQGIDLTKGHNWASTQAGTMEFGNQISVALKNEKKPLKKIASLHSNSQTRGSAGSSSHSRTDSCSTHKITPPLILCFYLGEKLHCCTFGGRGADCRSEYLLLFNSLE